MCQQCPHSGTELSGMSHGEVSKHTGDNVWILHAKSVSLVLAQLYTQENLLLSPFFSLQAFLVEEQKNRLSPSQMWFLDMPTLCSVCTKCLCCKGSAAQHRLCRRPHTGAALACSGCRGRPGAVSSVLWGFISCYSSACETSGGN